MKTFEGWYCAHCQRGVDASEVTFHEQHTVCGRTITDDVPPEPPVKESLTTEQPEDGPVAFQFGNHLQYVANHWPPRNPGDTPIRPLYPESVKAERDALRAEVAELKAHRARTAVKNLRLNNRIADLERKCAVQIAPLIDPDDPAKGASHPMILDSWRFGFVRRDGCLVFDMQDEGPFVPYVAAEAVNAENAELKTQHAIDAQTIQELRSTDWAAKLVEANRENAELRERVKELAEIIGDIKRWDISNLLLDIPHPLRKRMQAVLAAMQEGKS